MGQVYMPIENDKDGKVAMEVQRLCEIFKEIPADRRALAEKAIPRAAWLAISLEELEQCIDRAGYMSEYQNGENQWGTKKNPDVETHNTMSQRYTQMMDYLYKLLPGKPGAVDKPDGIRDFLRGRPQLAGK